MPINTTCFTVKNQNKVHIPKTLTSGARIRGDDKFFISPISEEHLSSSNKLHAYIKSQFKKHQTSDTHENVRILIQSSREFHTGLLGQGVHARVYVLNT